MKRTKNFNNLVYTTLFLITVLVVTGLAAGCRSGELSRSEAEKLIRESGDFKTPFQIAYTESNLKYNEGLLTVIADDETQEQAVARRISQYLELNPQIAVLNHFGLVVPQVVPREAKAPPRTAYSNIVFWHFREKYTGSSKAAKYWQEAGFQTNEEAFPLAGRDFTEVTGITKQGENQATVEFRWVWKPNEVGKALDSTSAEFKSLPVELQQLLTGEKIPVGELQSRSWVIDWRTPVRGQAMFQKYDDGWRLAGIFGL